MTGWRAFALSVAIVTASWCLWSGLNYDVEPLSVDVLAGLDVGEASSRVSVVVVDDASLDAIGERWPISRSRFAELLAILRELDAAAVGLDVVFREPSNPQVPPSVRAQLNSPELGAELREFLEPDALLAQELSRTDRVVLGTVLTAEHPPRFSTRLTDSNAVNDLSMPGEGASISNIAVATEWHGVLNVPMDADGAIRRHSRTYDGYGSLAAVLVERVQPGSVNWDSQGIVLLRLLDPESFERVRLSDLLRGREAFREVIEGRVVLIGADSELDRRVLYGAYRVPGVLVHATAVDNLLHGEQWQMDGMAAWLGALLTFLCHIAIGLGLERGGVARAVSMIAAVVVLFCTAWLVAFLSAGWVWVTLPAEIGTAS
ncbi:MAG: CHASE2 domain-containing protein [Myxococcota bacterium]